MRNDLSKWVLAALVAAGGFAWGLLSRQSGAPMPRAVEIRPGTQQGRPTPQSNQHGLPVTESLVDEPPWWQQLLRPSPETARTLLRAGMPLLAAADGSLEYDRQDVTVYWTGRADEHPQTLFQTMLPFLRPEVPNTAAAAPQPPAPPPVAAETTPPAPAPAPAPAPSNNVVAEGLPLVGIYHTHDWESYLSEFADLKPKTQADLDKIVSYDHKKRTVVTLGESLAKELERLGVTPVHAPHRHFHHTYTFAYRGSRDTARKILTQAPTTKLLIDIHRDGALGLDATTTIEGKRVAQIRCIIGGNNPGWQKNFEQCERLREHMEQVAPGISLPARVQDKNIYNQDLLPGAILLEIGNAPNSYQEAELAVNYLAQAIANMFRAGD